MRVDASIERLLPQVDAYAPAVTCLEPREAELGVRRNQIVTDGRLMAQEVVVHDHANGMFADVVSSCVAFAVAVKAGKRIRTASLEHSSQDVLCHY